MIFSSFIPMPSTILAFAGLIRNISGVLSSVFPGAFIVGCGDDWGLAMSSKIEEEMFGDAEVKAILFIAESGAIVKLKAEFDAKGLPYQDCQNAALEQYAGEEVATKHLAIRIDKNPKMLSKF